MDDPDARAETTPGINGAPVALADAAGVGGEGAHPFAWLGLGPDTLRAISDLGFDAPTPIQEQTIPPLLAGRDVIAQAPTGTGKTAAYGLPVIEHLDDDQVEPQALIVAPTRELAIQVAEALHAFGKYRGATTVPIYGGQPYERQFRALARGVQIVAGTPGRLLDHLQRRTLNLSRVRTVVLDEADEMLNMGFIEDIETLLAALPEDRQGALFSATIPPRIAHLAGRYLRDPERVSVSARNATAPRVEQVYYEVPGPAKTDALARILDVEEPESAIVFVRTRRDADELAERLNGLGYIAQPIHGDIGQAQRERTLNRFRQGNIQLLVATDVAARGLDIPDVSHVINYDVPPDAEQYVHRIGRTGRAGRAGKAISLVSPRERRQLRFIESGIRQRLHRLRLPTPVDIAARRRAVFRDDLLRILDDGQLDPFLALVQDLSASRDPAELAAAAFKMAAHARESTRPGRGELWTRDAPGTAAAAPESGAGVGGERRAERPRPAPVPRDERAPAESRERGAEPGMARLFIRVGRNAGVRPADLVGAIANEAGVAGAMIGDIDIYDSFSFVEVPEESAGQVIDALNGTTIRGLDPRASLARPEEGGQGRDDGRRAPGLSRNRYTPHHSRPDDRMRSPGRQGSAAHRDDRRGPRRTFGPRAAAPVRETEGGKAKGDGMSAEDGRTGSPMGSEIRLRDVAVEDLPAFYGHQMDSEVARMAGFPPRSRDAFMAHWAKILRDETVTTRTILADGHVAGNVVSFDQFGERHVGYWLGREFWGRGVATEALARFLRHEPTRPLRARVARHNAVSIRVLEKCGFALSGGDERSSGELDDGDDVLLQQR